MMGSNERNNWSDIVNAKLLIKEIVKFDVKFGRKRGISVICDLNDNAPPLGLYAARGPKK